ncbi:primosomal protein N' [Aliamphritea spongicola]|uniref:primosomal protein N' n=1 Tax=Aliamphritea spongicola TaxID=707589 RepID=UPI00196B9C0B|nr:primosomal protein N' [Aliamphritea spongicola]MBN3564669.1 primosomal protein N' [Aliamphritea spongicola]
MSYLRLAIPSPLRRLFDYLPPADCDTATLVPGIRVKVPFANRQLIGVLIEVTETTDVPVNKLKPALEILDSTPPLPAHLLKLARWSASYYQHPAGEALSQALPVLLRKGEADNYIPAMKWRACPGASTNSIAKNASKQRQLLQWLLNNPAGLTPEQLKEAGGTKATLTGLQDKGLIEQFTPQPDEQADNILREPPLTLNPQQQTAVDSLSEDSGFRSVLLYGITGSGKTEVYLQAIEAQLKQGKQALVLVPEIGLTPQTVTRFKARFNVSIVSLHSNLTDKQRLEAWQQARAGVAKIVIGTRSAIFTPLKHPGIIIIDEEHDASFKQQDGFRYSARDLSVMRAHRENIPIVLGSATPSIESLYNVQQKRYQWLQLTQRAGDAKPPAFELLDIRQDNLQDGLSPALIKQIGGHLQQGNQVLVFINRRGFAPSLMCHDCGWIADCRRCDAHMTLHRSPAHLHCHHCDSQRPIPRVCDSCGSAELKPVGAGTERTESALQQLFPETPVIRVDRDTTQRKQALQDIVDQVNLGDPCILVGTQMLAKGHHFPKVTLVAILNADSGLFSADFRGMERTAQQILQVAGRAGRAELPGKVVMQTHHADHPTINSLINEGYLAFAQQELNTRNSANLPPTINCIMIRAEARYQGQAERFLMQVRQQFDRQDGKPQWIGPLPSPMEKRAGMFRAQLLLQSHDRKTLHGLVHHITLQLEASAEARKIRWSVDVDPIEMF